MLNFDLTMRECRRAFSRGEIAIVQAHPHQLAIMFLTNKGDKGLIVTSGAGRLKRFKNLIDLHHAICWIKGL